MECWHCGLDITSKVIGLKIFRGKKLFVLCLECWKISIHKCYDLEDCEHCGLDITSKVIGLKIFRGKKFVLCLECWKISIHKCYDLEDCEHCGPECVCPLRSMAAISYRLIYKR